MGVELGESGIAICSPSAACGEEGILDGGVERIDIYVKYIRIFTWGIPGWDPGDVAVED